MARSLELLSSFQAHEGAWRRVLAYGCHECGWQITLRDYRSQPHRATKLGVAALNRHQTDTGHEAAWSCQGRA